MPTSRASSTTRTAGDRVTWTHDATYQLTREQRSGANSYDITYTYDPVGNRLVKESDGQLTTYVYDDANQLDTAQDVAGITSYTYDSAGNQVIVEAPTGGLTTSSWDDENSRTKVVLPSGEVVTSSYNGDRLRVRAVDSSQTRKFIWDEQNYLVETDDADATQMLYANTPDGFGRLVSQRRKDGAAWTTDFFHCDVLGSTTHLTDASETILETFDYDAWGNLLSSNTLQPAFLYVGEHGYYADWIENSLLDHYVRARTYDPATARWASEDPIGFTDGTNLYQYVANSPTSLVDPSGLIVIAIDGTDSHSDLGPVKAWNAAAILANGRIRSHVWEFYDDYRSARGHYKRGPNSTILGTDAKILFDDGFDYACKLWCDGNTLANGNRDPRRTGSYDWNPIDMVGFSRGGFIIMQIAKKLNDDGCCCQPRSGHGPLAPGGGPANQTYRPIEVRFLGLYDPVDMAPSFRGTDNITANVRNTAIARASTPFDPRGTMDIDHKSFRRPSATGVAGSGPVWGIPVAATHGAIGGWPCFNNITSTWKHRIPNWITSAIDVRGAIRADTRIRSLAVNAMIGLPIRPVAAYGYPGCVRGLTFWDVDTNFGGLLPGGF